MARRRRRNPFKKIRPGGGYPAKYNKHADQARVLRKRRRQQRKENPITSGDFFLFVLGAAFGWAATTAYAKYVAPPQLKA